MMSKEKIYIRVVKKGFSLLYCRLTKLIVIIKMPRTRWY